MMKSTDAIINDWERALPPTLSIEETAKVLKCSRRTVSRLIAGGEFRIVRTMVTGTARVIIPRTEVIRWLTDRMV